MTKPNLTTRLLLSALLAIALPLRMLATDVVVADANGNELTYSYDSADGPATFKAVKAYAADEAKAGRIIIADNITDGDGKSHVVKYINGSVGNRYDLVSIVFGQNIVAVGGEDGQRDDAFYDCDKLVSVTLNAKLEILGRYAFQNCDNLTDVNLGDCTNLTTMRYECFQYCTSLTELTIPASVTAIENYVISSCNALATITFMAEKVPNSFFSSSSSLTTINIGQGVKVIGDYAFNYNRKLTQLNFDPAVDGLAIGNNAFNDCDALESVTLPAGLASLGQGTFNSCDILKSVIFDEASVITDIPRDCFGNNPSLERIKFPNSVKTIGIGGFWYCVSLQEIEFGTGLIEIADDYGVFYNCPKLEKIILNGQNYPFLRNPYLPSLVVLYVNPLLIETYRTNDFTKDYRIMAIGSTTEYAVTTAAGGELQSKLPEDLAQFTQKLSVTGPLNGTDIDYLHSSFPLLEVLDLTDASIVAGGDPYYEWWYDSSTSIRHYNETPYYTEDNVVGSLMFYNMPMLRSLSLPSNTTKIGDWAMSQQNNSTYRLSHIDIPAGVTEIGRDAFRRTAITEVTIPAGVTRLEDETFYECNKLQKATLPDGITYIGNSCFSENKELLDVNMPTSLEAIGEYAFCNNEKRSTPIVFPATLKSIAAHAFRNNYRVKSITFNNGLESLGSCAFSDCSDVESISLPESITQMADRVFQGCDSITQFTFPSSITVVPEAVLYHCDKLQQVTLASGTTRIAAYAFENCPQLATMNLTEQTSLTDINIHAFANTGFTTVTLPNSLTTVDYSAFRECQQLESINVPTGLTIVPYDFVCYSPKLTSVQMHDGIRVVGHNAFLGCPLLNGVVLNDEITTIEYDAFNGCSSLQLTKLPDALTHIGDRAFRGTAAITGDLTVPSGVTTLGYQAFYESGITSAVLPESITSWGSEIFRLCRSLEHVQLPNSLTRVGNYMFQYCTSLEDIDLPESVTEIGYCAFEYSGLTNIELPENIQKIEDYSFSNSKLRSFRVPDGFTSSLGAHCLENCDSLRTAYMGRNEDYTGYSSFTCFNDCDSLQLLRVYAGTPPGTDSWGKDFRYKCILEVPEGTIELYQAASTWQDFKEIREFWSGDELREQDFAVMQAIYEKLNGASWTKEWNMENNRHAANKWAGVSTMQIGSSTQYAITALNLSAMGLTGELPQELFRLKDLTTLDLSYNHVSGNAGEIISSIAADKRSPLTDVNLRGNEITGDAYAIAAALPALTKLNLSYNQLTEVSQVIDKTTLTDLNLEMQFIDYTTKQTVAAAAAVAQDMVPGVAAAIELPSTFTYRHYYQDFDRNPSDLYRPYCNNIQYDYWSNTYELAKSEGLWNMDTYGDRVLRAPNGQPIAYAYDWQTVILRFTWEDGDVNADQTVDVTDLQSLVNFAFNDRKYNGEFFNFADADCNNDNVVNVSDIVGNVERILAYTPSSDKGARRIYNKVQENPANVISMEGCDLTLHNTDAVAAMQLTIANASVHDISVSSDLRNRFTVSMRESDDGVRIVIYSADGHTLQPGNHALLCELPTGATIAYACLSDADAHRLGFTIDSAEATSIEQLSANGNHDMQVFDLNGRRLASWQSLPSGVYVIRVNGKQYKVKK